MSRRHTSGLVSLLTGAALSMTGCSTYVTTLDPRAEIGDHVFERRSDNIFYRGVKLDWDYTGGSHKPVLENVRGDVRIEEVRSRYFLLKDESTGQSVEVQGEYIKRSGRCPFSFLWRSPGY